MEDFRFSQPSDRITYDPLEKKRDFYEDDENFNLSR